MKKKVCSLLLVLLMVVTMLPTVGWADKTTFGSCGGNLTWTLDDSGTLTIGGIGEMENFWSSSSNPWDVYKPEIKKVVISSGVTSIGYAAFADCQELTSVTIPDSVTAMCTGAFAGCTKLSNVALGSGMSYIDPSAFYGCKALTSIALPAGITSIGADAFTGSGLTKVMIPDKVTYIGGHAFSECEELTSVAIPDSVTRIGYEAFRNCSKLTSVKIPSGINEISNGAFEGCTGMDVVTIPDSVKNIGYGAFEGCSALADVYFTGTEESWNVITIDAGNDALRNATIHFAQPDSQPPVETSGTISVSSVRAQPGQTITVKLDLSANKGISNMRLQMSYPEGFTLESIQKGDALPTLTFTPPGKFTANPVNLLWDGTDADTSEGCILELTFRVADTVAEGDYKISLSYQKDDVLDGNLEGIDLTLQDGAVSVSTVTYSAVSGSVTSFGDDSEVTVRLLDKDGNEVAKTTAVSGQYSFANVAAGKYTLRVEKKNHVTRDYAITVGNADVQQDVEIWLIGDVTGDGVVDGTDAMQIKRMFNGKTSVFGTGDADTEAYRNKVANVYSSDDTVDGTDATQIKRFYNNKTSVLDGMK